MSKSFLLHFLVIITLQVSFAQPKDTLLLQSVLKKIETQHKVHFNYLEETIAKIYTTIPPEKLSLNEKLTFLSTNTHLDFQTIDNKFIVISNKEYFQGKIIDQATKKGISDVTITNLTTHTTVITDAYGLYVIKSLQDDTFEISHINYEKKQFYFHQIPEVLALAPKVFNLQEITNTFYLTKGIEKKAVSRFQITPQKMAVLPGAVEPDVFSTIQQIPGISSNNQLLSEISIRGGTHNQNLFLWNNVRLYQTSHFFGLISALNPNTFESISIFKNGSSSDYSNATSGVIAVNSRDNREEKKTSLGINFLTVDGVFTIPLKKSYLKIAARRSLTDFFNSPTYKIFSNRIFQNTVVTNYANNDEISIQSKEKFVFYDALVQWQKNISKKHALYTDILLLNNTLNIGQTEVQDTITTAKNSNLKQNSYIVSQSITSDWNSKHTTHLQLYYSYYEILSKQDFLNSEQTLNQENSILDTGILAKNLFKINNQYTLHSGMHLFEVGVLNFDYINSPKVSIREKNVIKSYTGYTNIEYLSNNTTFFYKIGFRQNYLSKLHQNLFEPNLIVSYKFKPTFKISYIYEHKHQFVYQKIKKQYDYLGLEKRRWTLANVSDMPVEKSIQQEIELEYKTHNWLINGSIFKKQITNFASNGQDFSNQLQNSQLIGSSISKGFEFFLQKKVNHFLTWLSYSYNDNYYQFDSFSEQKIASNLNLKHILKVALLYQKENFNIALGSTWHTGKPITKPQSEIVTYSKDISYEFPNSSNISDFFQLNFSTNYIYQLPKGKINCGISIQNLTSRQNTIDEYYRKNNAGIIEKISIYDTSLLSNIFIRYSF